MGASGIRTFSSSDRVFMAVPTDEQKRRCAGFENCVESERLMRFCRE